jgi:stress-induced morphogen
MPILQSELETTLKKHFPNAEIIITDLAGDNDHYRAEIIDDIFQEKTRIEQHKIVNKALKEEILSGKLHALQIKTGWKK